MTNAIHQPHDKLFKQAMADIRVARNFFEAHLPAEILQEINLDTLRIEKNTLIDAAYRASEVDVIYSVEQKHSNNRAYLHLHCEYQNKIENDTPFRLLVYKTKLMENIKKQNPDKPYPIVYSLVLYIGDKPWDAPLDILDLIDEPRELARQLLFKPYQVIDVQRIPDEELRKNLWCGLIEFTLKYRKAQDFARFLQEFLPWVDEISRQAANLAKSVLRYTVDVIQEGDKELFFHEVNKHLNSETKGDTMTIADQLRQEGYQQALQHTNTIADQLREEGYQKGLQTGLQKSNTIADQLREEGMQKGMLQGIQQGLRDGQVGMIIRLLKLRFRELPADYQQRIEQADTNTLIKWGERLLAANSLEEIFA